MSYSFVHSHSNPCAFTPHCLQTPRTYCCTNTEDLETVIQHVQACTPTRLSWQQGFPWEGKAVPLSNSRYKWSSHCLRALDVSSRDAVDVHPTCCHVVERMHEWGNQTEWIMSSSLAMISVIRRRQVLLQGPWSVLSPKACLDVLKLTGLTVQLPLCPPVPRALSARGWACSMTSNAEITITCCFSQWQ